MYDIEAKPGFQTDRLEKLYISAKDEKFTDAKFTVRGRSIFAHMVVLAACSEIFTKESVEKLNGIFSGFDDAVIDALLRFCYTGVINIEEDSYEKFKDLATQLEIYNLYYKSIDVKNSLEALTFSNDPDAIETAMYFTLENFENLYKTPDFLNLPFSTLIDILKSDYLCVSSEAQVMNCVKLWVDNDDDKRRPNLMELLSFVKLPGLLMEINITEVPTGFYSSPEYTKMVKRTINSVLKNPKNTSKRWKSVKIVLFRNIGAGPGTMLDIFDSKSNSWTNKEYFKFNFVSVLVDNWIMIIGDFDDPKVKYIDLKDGQMHTLKPMHYNRKLCSAVAIRRHSYTDVYVIGGLYRDDAGVLIISSSVERWNSKSKNWDFAAPLLATTHLSSATVIDDKIYVTGGILNTKSTNIVQMHSPDTEIWSYRASMKHKRHEHSSATINGKLYVAGGFDYHTNMIDTVEVFDPKANLWNEFCKLPSPRRNFSLNNFRNRLLCIGGMNDKFLEISDVLEYDDRKKSWKVLKKLLSISGIKLSAFVVPYESVI